MPKYKVIIQQFNLYRNGLPKTLDSYIFTCLYPRPDLAVSLLKPGLSNISNLRLDFISLTKMTGYANNFNVFRIIIRMYYAPKEHNPPHIHAYYQDHRVTIKILECEIMEGQIPTRQLRLIQAWIEIHRDELLADWELCQNGEKPFLVEPLK